MHDNMLKLVTIPSYSSLPFPYAQLTPDDYNKFFICYTTNNIVYIGYDGNIKYFDYNNFSKLNLLSFTYGSHPLHSILSKYNTTFSHISYEEYIFRKFVPGNIVDGMKRELEIFFRRAYIDVFKNEPWENHIGGKESLSRGVHSFPYNIRKWSRIADNVYNYTIVDSSKRELHLAFNLKEKRLLTHLEARDILMKFIIEPCPGPSSQNLTLMPAPSSYGAGGSGV